MIKEDSLVKGRPLSMDSNNSIDHDSLDSQIATLNSLIISDQDSLLDTRYTESSSSSPMHFNNVFADTMQFDNRHLFRNNSLSAITTNSTDYSHQNRFMSYPHQQLLRRESFPNLNATYLTNDGWPNYLRQQSPMVMRKFSADNTRRFFDARLTPSYSNPDLRRSLDADANPLLVSHFMRHMSIRRPSSVNEEKYATMSLEDAIHDIYTLSKDQYGCRFFQRKLEEQVPEQRDLIFYQTYPHFIELMTDPFGNYLCQKLMEYCTHVQRAMMIDQVANAIMTISLNMHGTRAVQKMIEVSTLPEQVEKIKQALSPHVVALIKDINGNHVIQKCLNKLSNIDKQFIYDAVSDNCTEVATHRHGCCVLQRCIDFSNIEQKKQLVNEIIRHALTLVQDPYGNYVVQYVLELGDAQFSDRLIRQFLGHVASLSVQKYSSNVMEKCIRVAEKETRRDLIDEMIRKPHLDTLLKDNFANYVIQTALDFAEESQHQKMSECIRPLLPNIRNTSYCKRIQGKLKYKSRNLGGIHPLSTDINFIPASPFYFS